jgi:GTP-binding protein HflX
LSVLRAAIGHCSSPSISETPTPPSGWRSSTRSPFRQAQRSSATVTGRRQRPDAATYAGKGKVEEVAARRTEAAADLVIFNHPLTGAQQRNLEQKLECRVVDRTSLILDIFALRARSSEGKLQVELAQVKHQLTRLVGGWTHLERQKGGIGLRGPGEKQLETDRRLLGERVRVLKDRLSHVERQRATQGRTRRRASVRTVALVGYTNAGKSHSSTA